MLLFIVVVAVQGPRMEKCRISLTFLTFLPKSKTYILDKLAGKLTLGGETFESLPQPRLPRLSGTTVLDPYHLPVLLNLLLSVISD